MLIILGKDELIDEYILLMVLCIDIIRYMCFVNFGYNVILIIFYCVFIILDFLDVELYIE